MKIDANVYMTREYSTYEDHDEFGCAEIVINDEVGVDYNFFVETIDGKKHYNSAFYQMYKGNEGFWETDYSVCSNYDIDFLNPDWKKALLLAGIQCALKVFWKEMEAA